MSSAEQSIDVTLSTPAPEPEGWDGRGGRVAFYSHDSLGLGHLRRTQKICAALMERAPELSALVITGSAHFRMSEFPEHVDVVKLPSVVKRDAGRYESRFLPEPFSHVFNVRSKLIATALNEFAPDVILVDHSPNGMMNELRGSFETVGGSACWMLGMRDIIDSAENVRGSWERDGVFETLEEVYSRIIVYGQKDIFDVCATYGLSSPVREKTSYCGFVTQPLVAGNPAGHTVDKKDNVRHVVVTIGGGDYYVEEVIGTFIDALKANRDAVSFSASVFPGAYLTAGQCDELRARAEGLPVTVHEFTHDLSAELWKSDLIVGAGGYNTVTEALAFGKRALLIPRVTMREEQVLRAKALESRGWVSWIHPDELNPDVMFSAVTEALSAPPSIVSARESGALELGGATNAARAILAELFASVKKREALQ